MFKPTSEKLEVRVVRELPDDVGGGVVTLRDGVRWLFVTPWGDRDPYCPDPSIDVAEMKDWVWAMFDAGEPISVYDLAEHLDVSTDVSLWIFREYAAQALLLQIAG